MLPSHRHVVSRAAFSASRFAAALRLSGCAAPVTFGADSDSRVPSGNQSLSCVVGRARQYRSNFRCIAENRHSAVSRLSIGFGIIVSGLLIGCVSQQKYDALQMRYDQLNQTMSAQISANQMHIERLQNAIRVTVNDELLFPSGDWQISLGAMQMIAKMAPILAPMQQTTIVVNGYTDNVPIGPVLRRQGITSNLILSQKRADNVMNFMISQGVNPSLISAQGFGDANPVASNDNAAGRAQNRRVELTLAGSGN